MIDRERKVDISKMKQEDVQNLSVQIGDKCREICDEAATKINSMLKIYGLEGKIAFQINELPKEETKPVKAPAKRAKKTKQANLK